MNKNILWLMLLLIAGACQPNSINEQLRADSDGGSIVVNHRLFTEVPLNNAGVCGQGNCAEVIFKLTDRLMALRPLPVPDSGQVVTVSVDEAHSRYRAFLTAHPGDNIIPIFQQRYARILLNQYGILDGKNTDLIVYYLKQMIAGGSLDFTTQINSLNALSSRISDETYRDLLDKVAGSAEVQSQNRIRAIYNMNRMIGDSVHTKSTMTGTLRPEFMQQVMKRTLADMKASDLPEKAAELRKMKNALKS